jgi:predicted DNA-binding transcriptional regulator AlpA
MEANEHICQRKAKPMMAINGENQDQPVFLPIDDVAARYAVSRSTIRRWVAAGILPPPLQFGDTQRWSLAMLKIVETERENEVMEEWLARRKDRASTDQLNAGAEWTAAVPIPENFRIVEPGAQTGDDPNQPTAVP